MVPIKTLLPDLKDLVVELDEDLLARAQQDDKIDAGLREAFQQVEKGGRTAQAFEVWREDYLDQVAVAWVLACVFVRFMEDNHLIDECWLAGEKERRKLAEDTQELFFRKHPHDTDREYFHHVFHEVGKIPAAKELFAEGKTPLWAVAPSGDAAMKLLAFWREIDAESGHLNRSFEVEEADTRFLGDLYQELSEKAKKKYALLQTPVFVEEFILDRTLNPAIDEFGLEKVRLIDPTCGSGHFLLGAFARLFRLWMKRENNEIVAAQKALDGVWGVDINPFAVAIARFRLIAAAIQACGIKRLKQAPGWKVHLAAGDSLLFGSRTGYKGERVSLDRQGDLFEVPAIYAVEEAKAVDEILDQGYHVVVGNPPYITVKDQAQNDAYRGLYSTCYRQYSLAVPFTQRFWELAVQNGEPGTPGAGVGYVGMITANSFMKREFGKKLIEDFFPKTDLTHVIDTSGAYIPGHGTPTVILLGRSRKPVGETVRAVLGIKGEASEPEDAAQGVVWKSIINNIDLAGGQNEWVSTADVSRTTFGSHPWSIGGGGASDLQERLNDKATTELSALIQEIGFCALTRDDDVFLIPKAAGLRFGIESLYVRQHITGENVRDWGVIQAEAALWPYRQDNLEAEASAATKRWCWPFRRQLCERVAYGMSQIQRGLQWFEYSMFFKNRFRSQKQIAFSSIATHNHFVLCVGQNLFNRHAPIIILPQGATEDDHLAIVGLLNSSAACFWMKQVMNCKGLGGQGGGIKPEHWSRQYEYTGTQMERFPVPDNCQSLVPIAKEIDRLAHASDRHLPDSVLQAGTRDLGQRLVSARQQFEATRRQMVGLQEELDWQVYSLYGLCPAMEIIVEKVRPIHPEDRAVEQLLKKRLSNGEKSIFYDVQAYRGTGSWAGPPSGEITAVIENRLAIIQKNAEIRMIEQLDFKRRWQTEPWEQQERRALKNWLLDRLEHKRYWPRIELQSTAQLADRASADAEFMQVAALYRGRADFDLAALVAELGEAESVPFLPILRYKASGLRNREVWERTWDLQRQEDERAKQRQALEEKVKGIRTRTEKNFESDYATLKKMEAGLKKEAIKVRDRFAPQVKLEDEWNGSRSFLALQGEELDGEGGRAVKVLAKAKKEAMDFHTSIAKKIDQALAKDDEYQAALTELDGIPDDPEIPVPPKYTAADFQKNDYWRLRGKLDVPKERWISYAHCQSVSDPTLVVGWAGWNHLERATALVTYYDARKREGWDAKRLTPLLAGLQQLLPWIHQWHPEIDKEFGETAGKSYQSMLEQDAHELGLTLEDIRTWQPPETTARRRTRK
jgi:hypothetical protein